ncbi:MAG TPA: Rieske 2Fe-2S domain-containing protein, partial [Candidatus Eisenbacteria bacterium]|nr:Rieske 2Fe-2S domain-containing protein [Candidatus Eisenbacteria bacterium]
GIRLADLAEGVPRRVTAGAVGAFLVRRGDQVFAMSSYCTHLPCELVWQADRKLLNCPCHNLAFDVDGQSMREGYPLPALPFVKVRVRNDGRVEVLGT